LSKSNGALKAITKHGKNTSNNNNNNNNNNNTDLIHGGRYAF